MVETHPFKVFTPPKARYLFLGSFPSVRSPDDIAYDWFYGGKRSQFWGILEKVYGRTLDTKKAKQELLSRLHIAITDIMYQCARKEGNSSDLNLTDIVYNKAAIKKVLQKHPIETIFFSSRFVEKEFKKHFADLIKSFPQLAYCTLPSPSPRYASMTKEKKIEKYQELLPKL